MKLKFLIGLAITSIAFTSCDDNTEDIGISMTDNMDHLEISTDTFNVSSKSFVADSVLSRNTITYLGKVRDPETGAYLTGNGMIQFHTLENYEFPNADSIVSRLNGKIIADSCEIRLYYTNHYGDSLAPMKMTCYEMDKPMKENTNYYSNFDPIKEGLIRTDGLKENKIYTLTNLNESDSIRTSSSYTPNIRIQLNKEYIDKKGVKYCNYGSYVMQKFYENPEYFKNSYNFINNVVPGFYFKNISGLGSMAYVSVSQLNVYFRYKSLVESSTGNVDSVVVYNGTASFAGTEEVLQTTTFSNDKNTINQLAEDNTCTYLKTPAGIFTELTLPVENIIKNHENDTINTAKIVLKRLNRTVSSNYSLSAPSTLLMIPRDSLYSFFEKNQLVTYKNSFLAYYSSTSNSYTFNNIAGMISAMNSCDKKSTNWNKVVIVPVTVSVNSSSVITKVVNDMSLSGTKLVGGSANPNTPITISIIYSKFK